MPTRLHTPKNYRHMQRLGSNRRTTESLKNPSSIEALREARAQRFSSGTGASPTILQPSTSTPVPPTYLAAGTVPQMPTASRRTVAKASHPTAEPGQVEKDPLQLQLERIAALGRSINAQSIGAVAVKDEPGQSTSIIGESSKKRRRSQSGGEEDEAAHEDGKGKGKAKKAKKEPAEKRLKMFRKKAPVAMVERMDRVKSQRMVSLVDAVLVLHYWGIG